MEKDEEILGVVEEVYVGGILERLEDILDSYEKRNRIVPVESIEMYEVIAGMELDTLHENTTVICTKYKTIDKKVKPTTGPLPINSERKRK